MPNAFQESFPIRSYDVDFRGDLKLNALFIYLQEIAGAHAEDLKVGFRNLMPLGLFWVLSRIRLRVYRYPHWHDMITVQTWPKGFHKLFALRDFYILSEKGEVLIAATSCWLLIDKHSLRPQRYERLPAEIAYDPCHHALAELPEKIKTPEELISEHAHKVTVSEIDVNLHVNNTRYVEWILDSFGMEHYEKWRLRSLQINFLEEAKFGNALHIRRFCNAGQNKDIYVDGLKESGAPAFQALTEWSDNNAPD